MVNLKYKLTVDDLIVEYMMYKVENGYEPKFLASEFMDFLIFFESKMQVEDSLYDKEKLFKRFFMRKTRDSWAITKNFDTGEKDIIPHMEMECEKDNDYIITANYKLSDYDKSFINTYNMNKDMVIKIRNIIGKFLTSKPKRKIDDSIEIKKGDLKIGKYCSAEIIKQIWLSHISNQIKYEMWPRQCTDINKYLFDVDLAKIIGVKSIKNELIKLYDVISKRIAILYNEDKNLKITSYNGSYLAYANYKLLVKGCKIIDTTFGPYKKQLNIDLSASTFTESHEIDGVYFEDDDPEVKTTNFSIDNVRTKKLVKNIEKNF